MKKIHLLIMPIIFSVSLNTYAKTSADESDLKTFKETNFCQNCDLSNAKIYDNHDNGSLLNSFAIKTVFKGSLMKMNLSGSIMTYCNIEGNILSPLNAQESNFDKVNLSYSEISHADLSGANFTDVNLSNSDFYYVNLSDADFTNANLTDTTFKKSILIGAKLTDEQLKQIKSIQCSVMPNGEMNSKGC